MPLPDFHSSDPYTPGIELERQVVNPPGYDLSQDSSALIAAVEHDITLAVNHPSIKASGGEFSAVKLQPFSGVSPWDGGYFDKPL